MIRKINFLVILFILTLPFLSVFGFIKGSFFKPQAINKLQGESFDYIVLGSSRGLTTLNTNLIDSLTGLNGYNASMDDQGINSWSIMLEHIVSKKIEFDTLILVFDVGSENVTEDEFSSNAYRWHSEISKKYVYKKFNLNLLNLSPWIHYNYWKNNKFLISSDLIGLFMPSKSNNFDSKGNFTYPSNSGGISCIDSSRYFLDLNNSNQLKEIATRCKQNNIYLVVYIAPYRCTKVMTNANTSFNIINHSDILENSLYFYDDIHVNRLGRHKATEEYIKHF